MTTHLMNKIQDKIYNRCQKGRERGREGEEKREEGRERKRERKGGRGRERGREGEEKREEGRERKRERKGGRGRERGREGEREGGRERRVACIFTRWYFFNIITRKPSNLAITIAFPPTTLNNLCHCYYITFIKYQLEEYQMHMTKLFQIIHKKKLF